MEITAEANSTGNIEYYVGYSEFGQHIGKKVFESIDSIIRDFICIALIVILNVLNLVFMKKAMKRKKSISTDNTTKSKAERAENRITIMVIFTGLVVILAHVPLMFYFLPIPALSLVVQSNCFYDITAFFYDLAYFANFFLYFFFNNVFKQTFYQLFRCIRPKPHSIIIQSTDTRRKSSLKPTTSNRIVD